MGEKMSEKVMRITKSPSQIRNIGVCAHIDHGKTTFSDNLIAGAGMMSGEIAGSARALDFHEDEQERGITIDSASVSMVHPHKGKEFLINLIDTPGHVDFGGDVTRAMRAVDGAIVLSCAVEGIMPQTETVLRQALKERVKPILFINKVDRLIREVKLTPEKMQEKFMTIINSVNKLIEQIAEPEYKEKWKVNVMDGSVAFGSAFHNWALSIPYMKEKGITFKDIIEAYESGGDEYKKLKEKAPIHEVILNMVIDHHPSPVNAQAYRIPKIWRGDLESEEGKSLLKADPNGPLFFVITKVVVDPQAGEIAAGRLFSGTMKRGQQAYLNRAKMDTRIQQVYIYNGAKKEIVDNVPAGNIIGVGGLRDGRPGETVTLNETEPFEQITHIFDPVVTKSIEAKKPADLPKLIEVLRIIGKEDPSIVVEINEETGEHLLHGMGELHLEIIEHRIIKEKGVDISTSPPIVVYREAITKESPEAEGKSPNKHNKLYFKVEPVTEDIKEAIKDGKLPNARIKKKDKDVAEVFRELGWDAKKATKVKEIYNGNIFLDGTRGIVYINEIMEMVLDMFEDVMGAGPLAKEPCTGVMVTLTDCKLHEDAIHRGPAQLYPAVRDGIRAAMMHAKPMLYEPLQILRLEAPVDFVGALSKLISSKRGQLLEMDQQQALAVVKAKIPVNELFGWSSDLRSATEGRGNSSLMDQMFEKLPNEYQEKIKKQIVERKGISEGALGA